MDSIRNTPDLSIIIVSYNCFEHLFECIKSVHNQITVFTIETIVVDNASSESYGIDILNAFSGVKWVQNDSNLGFGSANNIGVQNASGLKLLFLNPDVILNEDTIDLCMREAMQQNMEKAIIGCRLFYPTGEHQNSLYYYCGNHSEVLTNNIILSKLGFTNKPKEPIALMGSFLLLDRLSFVEIGGFDPDYFLYSEEIDLCRRLRSNGSFIYFFPEAAAQHVLGGTNTDSHWVKRQKLLSRSLLTYKTHGVLKLYSYIALYTLNSLVNILTVPFTKSGNLSSHFDLTLAFMSTIFSQLTIPYYYSKRPGNGKRKLTASR